MNTKTKKRLIIVTGIIIMVLIGVLALVGGSNSAKAVTVDQAVSSEYLDEKVQVSGNVVPNSYKTSDNKLTFEIYDPESTSYKHLKVQFEGAVAATFGNDVTAICTGKIKEDGVLHATELVTKCPSKYESSTGALSVAQLLEYGESIYDKPVKVAGVVKPGTLKPAGQEDRFILLDQEKDVAVAVYFDGALPEGIADKVSVVITGSLDASRRVLATDIALEG